MASFPFTGTYRLFLLFFLTNQNTVVYYNQYEKDRSKL